MNIKNIAKIALTFFAFSFVFVSCKKDLSSTAPFTLNQAKADVVAITSRTVTGNYGNPALGPSAFGTRYFNVITGANDSIGSGTFHLRFTGTNNGTIFPRSAAYVVKFLNTTKALADIELSDYTAASDVSTSGVGRNTSSDAANAGANANGWWSYNTVTHQAQATANVVVFVRIDENTVYVLKPTAVSGQGSATSNRAVYTFNVGVIE